MDVFDVGQGENEYSRMPQTFAFILNIFMYLYNVHSQNIRTKSVTFAPWITNLQMHDTWHLHKEFDFSGRKTYLQTVCSRRGRQLNYSEQTTFKWFEVPEHRWKKLLCPSDLKNLELVFETGILLLFLKPTGAKFVYFCDWNSRFRDILVYRNLFNKISNKKSCNLILWHIIFKTIKSIFLEDIF